MTRGTKSWELELDALETSILAKIAAAEGKGSAAAAAAFRTLIRTAGRASGVGASGTKYLVIPALTNSTGPSAVGAEAEVVFLLNLVAARIAIAGLTTKLRVVATAEMGATKPNVTLTFGLYPITIVAGTLTPGTVVPGSTFEVVANSANEAVSGESADFALPADGRYAVGYTLSGTPATNFNMRAAILEHAV